MNAQRSGLMPLQCGQARLDILDALRSPLNLANGAALTNIAIAESALKAFPDQVLQFSENRVGSGFVDSTVELAEIAPQIRIRRQPAKPWQWLQLRTWGWLLRDAADRRLRRIVTSGSRTSKPFILAVPRMSAHFSDMAPVARALQERFGIATLVGATSREIYALAKKEGLRTIPLRGSSTGEIRSFLGTSFSILPELLELVQNQEPDAALVSDIENRTLIRMTCRTLTAHYASAVDVAVASARTLLAEKPRLVTVGNPYTVDGRIAARIAHEMGVPTVAQEHGSIFPNDPIWQECFVDRVCAWGNPSKRALLSCGLKPEQIAVTGAPRFDAVLGDTASSATNRNEYRDYILVATSGAGDQVTIGQHLSFIRMLFEVVEELPEVTFVVKLHKKDRAEYYRSPESGSHHRVRVVKGQRLRDGLEIFEYLKRARGLVTISSSAAIDAMAMRVPVIAVDAWWPAPPIQGVEFLELGCTRQVRGVQEFVKAVRDVWRGVGAPSDAIADSYADDHFANRGAAAVAVANEMVSAMSEVEFA